ncbi:hypothetical protein MTQ01_09300 [Streptomyces sp. XM4193]|uniref:hypothetical protein n=1 Tax=Streptomyces sp. XM4193 TaxID=2929782 RepID=UPI001FF9832A|nr:hypothetical protein [Streptomyces sp. XM4193]MCK1796195.1 hypothetical protein [Streptomyces sp. XM4193]
MRKTFGTLAVLGLAGAGALVPLSGAQAAPAPAKAPSAAAPASAACDTAYRNAAWGYMYNYANFHCGSYLGRTKGDGNGWSTKMRTTSSVVNKGTYSNGYNVIKFYSGANYTGGHSCLKQSEYYVDNLSRNTFTNGTNVNNNIKSHKWVRTASCSKFMS